MTEEEKRLRESIERDFGELQSFDSVEECFAYLNSLDDEDEEN